MIFARSRRSTLLLAAAGFAVALAFAASGILAVLDGRPVLLLAVMAIGTASGLALTAWGGLRLRRWPAGRLAFFRDRMVVVQGRTELRAPWDRVEAATLTVPHDWGSGNWPELNVTDNLTLRLRDEGPLQFRPAAFGLEPAGCRDLILRLRDHPELRERLPEFDSDLDLAVRPVVAGELIKPRL